VSHGTSRPEPGSRGRLGRAAAKFVGFFDSVNKVVGALAGLLALAAALGLVTLTGGDKAKKTATPVRFSAAELAPVTNERFAFSFSYPRTWERQDAFNADGSVFRAPNESAELRAFGVNAHEGPTNVLERVEYLAQRKKQAVLDEGGQILSDDLRFVAWDGPNDDRTPASRLTYRSRDPATGQPVTAIAMLTSQQGRDVTISCQVVRGRFHEFEGACNQLVGTLKLDLLSQPPLE
jgi:hypothetical protein